MNRSLREFSVILCRNTGTYIGGFLMAAAIRGLTAKELSGLLRRTAWQDHLILQQMNVLLSPRRALALADRVVALPSCAENVGHFCPGHPPPVVLAPSIRTTEASLAESRLGRLR